MDNFDIIYEDNDVLVVYKPAGMAVQTRRLGQQDLETQLKNYRARKQEKPYIGVIHRLDQPVEGVMVFAKNPAAASNLSAQVQKREIGKYYYAIGVCGGKNLPSVNSLVGGKKGSLTDYLTFDARNNLGAVSNAKDPQAKKAVLDYQALSVQENRVLFDIHLHTGRHHQIRLQLSHFGFPLLGDTKYGAPAGDDKNIALCSYRINFSHPSTGKEMDFRIKPKNKAFRSGQIFFAEEERK